MINTYKLKIAKFLIVNLTMVGIIFGVNSVSGQQLNIGPDTTICGNTQFELNINGYPPTNGINSTVEGITGLPDDGHSTAIPLPFPFTFFGNVYNSCVVSSNNYISFDASLAGQYSPYTISYPIPSPLNPTNCIMAPWQDTNPNVNGSINYATVGDAPNRVFIITFIEMGMFGTNCSNICFGNQVRLYEGTNEIQIHIAEKTACPSWNGGYAIEGIQNIDGTIAFWAPGRNYPSQWNANSDGYSFMPTGPGTYTVTAIPFEYTSLFTSGPGVDISWYDSNNNLIGNGSTYTFSPVQTETYVGRVDLGCSGGTLIDTITVYVSDTQVDTVITESSCVPGNDGEIEVTATGSFSPYDITIVDNNNNPVLQNQNVTTSATAAGLAPGNYDLTVVDDLGCNIPFDIVVPGPPALIADTNQTNILCNGETNGTAIVKVISGTQPYAYQWSDPKAQTTDTAVDLAAGLYIVTITDDNACVIEETFVISEPMPLILQMSSITDTCEKEVGTALVNVLGGTEPYSYLWSNVDVNDDTLSLVSVADSLGEGDYDLIVTDFNGCIDTNEVSVNNLPSPVAKFIFLTNPAGILEPVVEFTNESQNSETWWWDFGDNLGVSSEEHPVYEYTSDSADVYKVMLVSTNEYQCHDTVYGFVTIKPHFTFYVPNAFTPRSNGINDMFTPVGEGFDADSYKMTIYDRWGQIVFQTNDIKNGWDGNSHRSGQKVPNGTYMYKIEVREPIGFEPKYFYGHVNVIWDSGYK